ncbi:MAG: hypothetical protein AAFZ18_12785 [Myxococcota bacterium]
MTQIDRPAESVTTKVRIGGSPAPAGERGVPLLSSSGPDVVLGGADPLLGGVEVNASSLFGPRGACLLRPEGPLVVSDTGHHRLLVWSQRPDRDGRPADFLIGQPDFHSEGRNGGGEPHAATVNVPTGVSRVGHGFAVADGWNSRVLIWRDLPTRSHQPADVVLGQADFTGSMPNRGQSEVGAGTMHWPFAVLEHEGRLVVADTGNRRVLIWDEIPTAHGTPADHVLGQPSLQSRSDNGGEAAGPGSFRWPHDLAVLDGQLLVSDAGNNRVLIFPDVPSRSGALAAAVLGQADFSGVDHNRGTYWPDARCMNMPYALTAWPGMVAVADTASSRLLGFSAPLMPHDPDRGASHLTGQEHFGIKGDNRWQAPARDSLCWPYGIDAIPGAAVIADTGNHRVLIWRREGEET